MQLPAIKNSEFDTSCNFEILSIAICKADFENFINFSKCRKSCITICITVCITLAILGEKFRIFKNLSGAEKKFCITICITVVLEIGSGDCDRLGELSSTRNFEGRILLYEAI